MKTIYIWERKNNIYIKKHYLDGMHARMEIRDNDEIKDTNQKELGSDASQHNVSYIYEK